MRWPHDAEEWFVAMICVVAAGWILSSWIRVFSG